MREGEKGGRHSLLSTTFPLSLTFLGLASRARGLRRRAGGQGRARRRPNAPEGGARRRGPFFSFLFFLFDELDEKKKVSVFFFIFRQTKGKKQELSFPSLAAAPLPAPRIPQFSSSCTTDLDAHDQFRKRKSTLRPFFSAKLFLSRPIDSMPPRSASSTPKKASKKAAAAPTSLGAKCKALLHKGAEAVFGDLSGVGFKHLLLQAVNLGAEKV